MIGLDTNVLIRYIVQDDPKQAGIATRLIESKCTADTPGYISFIVLVEVAWVLARAYGYSRDVISGVLQQVLSTAELVVENHTVAWLALSDYQNSSSNYSDCLIGRIHQENGCEVTVTFDKKAGRIDTFQLLK
ncbi:MAG: type II toxin-antitoxin system VapC family toxin [Pseudomonadota bacterium]